MSRFCWHCWSFGDTAIAKEWEYSVAPGMRGLQKFQSEITGAGLPAEMAAGSTSKSKNHFTKSIEIKNSVRMQEQR
jgi:hypothetical protein